MLLQFLQQFKTIFKHMQIPSELNKYGTRFKYSKFLGIIDQSHQSITSNLTSIQMRRDVRLATNQFAEYAVDFGNHMHVQSLSGYNIKSSPFRVLDITDDVYLFDEPNDTKTGVISLYSLQAPGSTTPVVRRRNVGAIDYMTGRITLNPINITSVKIKMDYKLWKYLQSHIQTM